MGFSGAVKVADVSDYIAPAQACVVALSADSNKIDLSDDLGPPEASGQATGEVSLQRRTVRAKGARRRAKDKTDGSSDNGAGVVKPPGFGFTQVKGGGGEKDALKVTLNDCLACSGCVTSAETVLLEQQSTEEFLRVLGHASASSSSSQEVAAPVDDRVVVVTLSSQSRASLASHYGLDPREASHKLCGFLKRRLGVRYVFEDDVGREVALRATLEEFWDRHTGASGREAEFPDTPSSPLPLPLLTSECPGWVLYAEKTHGNVVLPYMSRARSAIAALGALTKKCLPGKLGCGAANVYHCFVSPCYDKKLEASREDLKTAGEFADLDCVLATTEFQKLLSELAFDPSSAPSLPCDNLLRLCGEEEGRSHEAAPVPLGTSGGYLEYVFRECALRLKGRAYPAGKLPLKIVRNQDFQEMTLYDDDDEGGKPLLQFALAYGFRNIQNIIRRIKQKKMTYHFVEVMACPSGCLNGGGQMKEDRPGERTLDRKVILEGLERLHVHNGQPREGVARMVDSLGGLKSEEARKTLFTEFHDRSQKKGEEQPTAMVIDF